MQYLHCTCILSTTFFDKLSTKYDGINGILSLVIYTSESIKLTRATVIHIFFLTSDIPQKQPIK